MKKTFAPEAGVLYNVVLACDAGCFTESHDRRPLVFEACSRGFE
jgi:hypothetical protein